MNAIESAHVKGFRSLAEFRVVSAPVEGTRQGKIVLAELRDEIDPETGEHYTVKRYESEKAGQNEDGDCWCHVRVTLRPRNPRFQPIVLAPQDEGQVHGFDRSRWTAAGARPAVGPWAACARRSASARRAAVLPRRERQASWPAGALGRGHCDSAGESLSSE